MRAYQRITWLGGVLLSSCPDCGAVVCDRERHDKWHADYDNHGHPYAAAYGPGGEWDKTTGPVPGKDRSLT